MTRLCNQSARYGVGIKVASPKQFIGESVMRVAYFFKGLNMLDTIKNWWHDLQSKVAEILADFSVLQVLNLSVDSKNIIVIFQLLFYQRIY